MNEETNEEPKPEFSECRGCGHPAERRPRMFYWKGRYFHGLVCTVCNSLWDDPKDSFEQHVGLKPTA